MDVTMMDIWRMSMRVLHRGVLVVVRMRFGKTNIRRLVRIVVFVVQIVMTVAMLVHQHRMFVQMPVILEK